MKWGEGYCICKWLVIWEEITFLAYMCIYGERRERETQWITILIHVHGRLMDVGNPSFNMAERCEIRMETNPLKNDHLKGGRPTTLLTSRHNELSYLSMRLMNMKHPNLNNHHDPQIDFLNHHMTRRWVAPVPSYWNPPLGVLFFACQISTSASCGTLNHLFPLR